MTKIIEIVISPEGQTQIETKGFAGQSCRDASRFIEEALGNRAVERLTAEFHLQQERAANAPRGEADMTTLRRRVLRSPQPRVY